MPRLLVDADACPVKEQIFNICYKFKIEAILVANTYFRIPESPFLKFKLVSKNFDAADDWITENTDISTIVITSDILLAGRCLNLGTSAVISPYGRQFSKQNIGTSISDRAIKADLRGGIETLSKDQQTYGKKEKENFINLVNKALTKLNKESL